jgi:hypothetical protein
MAPTDEPEHEAQVAQTRERLGESAFAAAWEAGSALTWEQAVAYALEDDPTPDARASCVGSFRARHAIQKTPPKTMKSFCAGPDDLRVL